MIISCICSRVKSIFLVFVNLFKRALCIINRRKRSDSNCEPLEIISVVSNDRKFGSGQKMQDRDWNSWDDSPRTVEEHIEKYREQLAKPEPPPEPEQEVDFFQIEGLVPKIVKQERVLVATEENTKQATDFSRLQATYDIPVINELKDWEELEGQGWDEAEDDKMKQIIREKRRELRHQNRQQQQQRQDVPYQPTRNSYGR